MNQIAYIGKNSINYLADIIKENSPRKAFIVTGKLSYEKSGAKKIIEQYLGEIEYYRFCNFEENPKIEDVYKGIDIFNRDNYDMIIAIGGGSAIDMAKLINILSQQQGDIKEHIINNKITYKGKNLIAIPTTAGTGSEATHFAVIYIDGKKFSLAHKYILPDYAIVDPQFTYSSSKYISACTGADALCQAIESMWAIGGTDESRQYAEKAIDLLWNNLYNAVIKEEDKEAKDNVSQGAYWAGRAINISKTTAPHAISYELTSKYQLPHGHAVALTLAEVMKINYYNTNSSEVKKNIEKTWLIMGATEINKAADAIQSLWKKLDLEVSLNKLGVKKSDIENIANKCNIERMSNNPAKLVVSDITNLLNKIF